MTPFALTGTTLLTHKEENPMTLTKQEAQAVLNAIMTACCETRGRVVHPEPLGDELQSAIEKIEKAHGIAFIVAEPWPTESLERS